MGAATTAVNTTAVLNMITDANTIWRDFMLIIDKLLAALNNNTAAANNNTPEKTGHNAGRKINRGGPSKSAQPHNIPNLGLLPKGLSKSRNRTGVNAKTTGVMGAIGVIVPTDVVVQSTGAV